MSDQENNKLLLAERKGAKLYLTLNRPEVFNALNEPLLLALRDELKAHENDSTLRAVILRGAGDKAFSSGADIDYLHQASPHQVRDLALLALEIGDCLENMKAVSIALINGFALGGGLEIAEACTMRIAVETARFGHPEVRLGALAGWGGTSRLPRLIGKGRAAELLLTGKTISADEALQMGLLNSVCTADKLHGAGEMLMRDIFQNAPLAVSMSKDAIQQGLDLSLEASTRLGADYFALLAATEDFGNGTKAFLQKQKPEFHGR